jgi:hypothetical protein
MPMVYISCDGNIYIDEQTFTVDLHELKSPVQVEMLIKLIAEYLNTFGHRVCVSNVCLFPSNLNGMHTIDPAVYPKISFDICMY